MADGLFPTASKPCCPQEFRLLAYLVGTNEEAREMERSLAQVALSQARASGSWRTIVAPPGEHRPLQLIGSGPL